MTLWGLKWNKSTDVYTRLEGAVGKTPGVAFDNLGPWKLKPCRLANSGQVTSYCGHPCYDLAVNDMEMVQIPQCYYYNKVDGNEYYWYFSDDPADTVDGNPVKLDPSFSRDGVIKPYQYIGRYEGYFNPTTSMLESLAGKKPTASKTIAQFRTAARLRAGGVANKWEQQDYLITALLQRLYLVEHGGFNSQALISNGVTNITDDAATNMAINTGYTAALSNSSGTGQVAVIHYQTGQTTYAMAYRWVENLFGNLYKFIDGINIKADYMPWIADHDFASDTFAHPYVDTGLTLGSADGWASDIAIGAGHDYGFLPSAVGASATTKLCDYYYRAAGNKIACFGGSWTLGGIAGAFYWALNAASSIAYRYVGARLLYVG
jgi:hypothetical protein